MPDQKGLYSIGNVERDTGIGRDTLRIWERRYGFPAPARNEKGERVYSLEQVRRLQRIRRLMDQGLRPGKLVGLPESDLTTIEAGLVSDSQKESEKTIAPILDAVVAADINNIKSGLRLQYEQQGMCDFIHATVVPLLKRVGSLWAAGRLQVFHEHLLSQQLIRFLHSEIANLEKRSAPPGVLLATLPGEEHTLGLLLVAALLSSRGINTINLGGEVPMDQIVEAVKQSGARKVGITFSSAYPHQSARTDLLELRVLLPDEIELWVGGEGVHRLRKLPEGVKKFSSLSALPV
jgi:methanogenic corrinoid protein MtbC1